MAKLFQLHPGLASGEEEEVEGRGIISKPNRGTLPAHVRPSEEITIYDVKEQLGRAAQILKPFSTRGRRE